MIFKNKIRTRFAPSPTGSMHVGNLRTAIYAYLLAKHNKGVFYLRIEDTDKSREVSGGIENLIKILNDFGLKYNEGPILKNGKIEQKGKYGPYIQSQRIDLYQKWAKKLVEYGHAYYCFCSSDRLTKLREDQSKANQITKYDGFCRNLSLEEVQAKLDKKEPYVIRLKVPENEVIKFNDLIRGDVEFNTKDIDDSVLLKSDGYATYHLAHVVDDHFMETTHVIRGEEWLSSTPKHLILFKYFDWAPPQYAHMSLLLNPDKTKLSKRQGDVAVEDYLAKGYLKEALINFIATIGWTEGEGSEQEIYSLNELVKKFDITRVNKAGAIFNLEKLDFINSYYIKKLNIKDLTALCLPYLKDIINGFDYKFIERVCQIEQERLKKISDIKEGTEFFFQLPDYSKDLLIWKKLDLSQTKENLIKNIDYLVSLADNTFKAVKTLEESYINWIKANNYATGDILWPLRVSLSGLKNSPSPFEILWVLGKDEAVKRIKNAISKLE